ncbi:MAG: hypothetical protein FWC95_01625 [Defluviitaleaceae bacterium]|nr:hypothetical protein [Defluviitaleaceae bacterium]
MKRSIKTLVMLLISALLSAFIAITMYGNRNIQFFWDETLTEEEALRGLTAIWEMARFGFPMFHLLPDDFCWDGLYEEFIPKVTGAQDFLEYNRLLRQFAACLGDSKTFVVAQHETQRRYIPQITFAFIENEFVVISADRNRTEIPLKSVLVNINGFTPVEYFLMAEGRFTSMRTPMRLEWDMVPFLNSSQTEKSVEFILVTPYGDMITETIYYLNHVHVALRDLDELPVNPINHITRISLRNTTPADIDYGTFWIQEHENNIHRIALSNFPTYLTFFPALEEYIFSVKDTAQAIIFDLRGNLGGHSQQTGEFLAHFIRAEDLSWPDAYIRADEPYRFEAGLPPLIESINFRDWVGYGCYKCKLHAVI